jgi:hypothetical protein
MHRSLKFFKKPSSDDDGAITQDWILKHNRNQVNEYKQNHPTKNSSDKIGILNGVWGYSICSDDIELITTDLNRCTGLSLGTQTKVFLVHIGNSSTENDAEQIVSMIIKSIKHHFDVNKFDDVKIKVWIGSSPDTWPKEGSSIQIALDILFKLKLLDRVVKELQESMKSHILPAFEVAGSFKTKVNQFLKIKSIQNKSEIKKIIEIIEIFKKEFKGKSNCIFEKIDGYASSNHLIDLPKESQKNNRSVTRSGFNP